MDYFTAWLSLIGRNEAAAILAIAVALLLADRAILWLDAHPWPGLIALWKRR